MSGVPLVVSPRNENWDAMKHPLHASTRMLVEQSTRIWCLLFEVLTEQVEHAASRKRSTLYIGLPQRS